MWHVLLDIFFVTMLMSKRFKRRLFFGGKEQAFVQLDNGRNIYVRGKVDRIDRLKTSDAIGVVDYKSSLTQFKLCSLFLTV